MRTLIEKPRWGTLEYPGEQLEQCRRRQALAALDHAEIRHRRREVGIALDAAHRQLLECESVALAQCTQLRTEEVAFAQQFRHVCPARALVGAHVILCEINNVKFSQSNSRSNRVCWRHERTTARAGVFPGAGRAPGGD